MDLLPRRPEFILPDNCPRFPLWSWRPRPMKKPRGNPKYYRREKRPKRRRREGIVFN